MLTGRGGSHGIWELVHGGGSEGKPAARLENIQTTGQYREHGTV